MLEHPKHPLKTIDVRRFFIGDFKAIPNQTEEPDFADSLERLTIQPTNSSYTFRNVEGSIILCGGFVPVIDGVKQAWLTATPLIRRYAREVYHECRRLVDAQFSHGVRRLQAITLDRPELVRFVQRMGFECEGLMRDFYGDGVDAVLFGRVR